jgi:hypothetical protein
MSNLTIRKKSLNTWLHTDSIFGDFIISKFYFNSFFAKFQIVEEGNTRLEKYEIANITLYDDTDGGTPETFSTITELSLRLEALQYPAFDRTGTTVFPSMEQITNVNVTDIEDNQVLAWDVATSKWVNITIGGLTTPTFQEVTEAGNETTIKTIFRTSETEWVEIGGDNNGIAVFNDEFGSLPTPKRIIDMSYNGLGINRYDTDTGELTGFAGIGDKTLIAAEIVGLVPVKSTTITPDKIVKRINGTTTFEIFLPSEDNDLNGSKVISANTTAKNAINYLAVANLTMTDITPPSEGAFYEVTVINGAATIGGVGYTVGQKVFRHYHSGSWRTFVTQNASSLSKIVIKDTASSAPVTGTTLNTLAKTYQIQGGTFDGNDAFNLEINAQKSSTLGTATIRVYVNTVNNFATATLYSTTPSPAASIRDIPLSRLRSNFKGTNLIVVEPFSGLISDLNQGFNAPRTSLSLNPANTFFVFVAIQNANAGDSTTIESVHLTT